MTAPDHTTKPLENILRERGHPYMEPLRQAQSSTPTTRAVSFELRAFTRRFRQRRIVSSLVGMPIRLIKRSPGRPPTPWPRR